MAEFLTTQGTSYHIENIIVSAKNFVILVSPYLSISPNFYDRLQDTDKRKVKTILIYGKDELKTGEWDKLKKLRNLMICFCENLHAKCYLNEEMAVITSMNMYEFSEKNNREMGIFISKQDDTKAYSELIREVQSIVNSQATKIIEKVKHSNISRKNRNRHSGYCIRCGVSIPFDLTHPFCFDCFKVWSKCKDPKYPEIYCHHCGEVELTTMSKPLCYECYLTLQRR